MTQEDKQLLLKDLCARLPYGVKMKYKDESGYEELCQIDTFYNDVDGFKCLLRTTGPFGGFQDLNELKPYLRPMSSMTEDEKNELNYISHDFGIEWLNSETDEEIWKISAKMQRRSVDFYNAHYLDYRGLIPMGLALEAPDGMYKIE